MPSKSHGRICLVVVLLVVALFVLSFRYGHASAASKFTVQYSHSGNSIPNSIGNDTLGFEKIFVINAPWRTDRKDSISLGASYSGISVDWIDGVNASEIQEKAYPPGNHRFLPHGNLGSWRAHMDAIREIVQQNLTTALILEDDADWDFRIRSQLSGFSHAVRRIPDLVALSELHSHQKHTSSPGDELSPVELAKRSTIALPPINPRTVPKCDPYGRDWDVLWLGHCGANLPPPSPRNPNRLMLLNDDTVPSPKYLKPTSSSPLDPISSLYPPHARLVHRANTTLCTLAYAVTQSGARRLLYEFGVREFSKGYDFALSDFCNGLTRGARREAMLLCVTVNPPIFGHFWSERGGSDIMGVGPGGREMGTRYVRASVRGNLEGLVRGEGVVERWGDEEGNSS